MSEGCEICGTALKNDLFASVCQEPVCAICKQKFIGGLPTSPQRIMEARQRLNLKDGEHLQQDNAEEARRILGR